MLSLQCFLMKIFLSEIHLWGIDAFLLFFQYEMLLYILWQYVLYCFLTTITWSQFLLTAVLLQKSIFAYTGTQVMSLHHASFQILPMLPTTVIYSKRGSSFRFTIWNSEAWYVPGSYFDHLLYIAWWLSTHVFVHHMRFTQTSFGFQHLCCSTHIMKFL